MTDRTDRALVAMLRAILLGVALVALGVIAQVIIAATRPTPKAPPHDDRLDRICWAAKTQLVVDHRWSLSDDRDQNLVGHVLESTHQAVVDICSETETP